jgi:hypothetical protein
MNSNQRSFRNDIIILTRFFNKSVTYGIRVLLIILTTSNFTYSQDVTSAKSQDLNNFVPIIFDFETKKFDKIFPFDQSFSIEIINIEPHVDEIFLEIYEYNLGGREFKTPRIVNPNDLEEYRILYVTESWTRRSDSEVSGEIPIPYILKPNQNYIIGVFPAEPTELLDIETDQLSFNLKNDKSISDFINKISLDYMTNTGGKPKFSALPQFQNEFNILARNAVMKTDPRYRISLLQIDTQATDFKNYVAAIQNLYENTLDQLIVIIKQKFPADKKLTETLTGDIEKFRSEIKKIKWATVKKDDEEFKNLQVILDKMVFPNFSPGSVPSFDAEKQNYDLFFNNIIQYRDKLFEFIVEDIIAIKTFRLSTFNSTYRTNFVENASLYITLDLGAAYVWKLDRVLTYSGVNIYFRPVNKNIPLSHYSGKDSFLVRSSLLVGITLNSVDKENVRKGLFGTSALVLGGGFRINPFLKISGGSMVYYSNSNNPLLPNDRYTTTFSPFISLSIDVDVKPLFGGIGEAIFKK